MRAMMVEVCSEIEQLVFEIRSGPEQRAIQVLTSNRAVLLRSPLCGVQDRASRSSNYVAWLNAT
jgi:hypothetical protein